MAGGAPPPPARTRTHALRRHGGPAGPDRPLGRGLGAQHPGAQRRWRAQAKHFGGPKEKGKNLTPKPFSWVATAPRAIAGRKPARVLVVELALLVGHALALLRVARVARQYPRDRGRGELHHAHAVGCSQAINQSTQSDHANPVCQPHIVWQDGARAWICKWCQRCDWLHRQREEC
jgi:hypothetical protein